jgi:hypothetical protein
VGRALHDGLRALEIHRAVETLHQGVVAVAGEQRAELRHPEGLVHLRVPAAGHVEGIALGRILEHVHLQRIALAPGLEAAGQVRQPIAARLLGEPSALLARHVHDHVAGEGEYALPAELLAQGLQHGNEDARLDLAPLEDADLVEGVGGCGSRSHGHASFEMGHRARSRET